MADREAVKQALRAQKIELPSWAFGNTGTRFKVFAQPGVPRTPQEKIADAAQVHKFTGVAPSVAVHIPWDKVGDYGELAAFAADAGIAIGTVNANVFQDDDYKLGSVANPDPAVRRKALDHLLECVDIMDATGSRDLKLWFADGTNYPGQDDIRARQDRLAEALHTVYQRLGPDQRMLLEYKLFEPSFYADDDLMVGAADPFQLFRILYEVTAAGALGPEAGIAFMLDQCHNIEPKIPAQIRSVMNVQEATAKALLIDTEALATAQQKGDVLGANAVLMDAYNTDVRPLLAQLREEMGLEPDPIAAYHRSGYGEKITADRIGGTPASWGS